MSELTLRAPTDDDWPAILILAEQSLAELPNAPSQQEWLNNRKSFSASDGIQQHFVAISSERIVGYAGAERRNEFAKGGYRLFVVVAPSARSTLGTMLLAKLRECLISLGARRAWFQEDEAQKQFISYLEEHGFVQVERFRLDDGTWIIRLAMDAPFPIVGLA
jgi:N-acetylglutamate synthase-like GNAT family acetyltransferase